MLVDGLLFLCGHCKGAVLSLQCAWENVLKADRSEVLQGTLDLTIPKALYALGPATRIPGRKRNRRPGGPDVAQCGLEEFFASNPGFLGSSQKKGDSPESSATKSRRTLNSSLSGSSRQGRSRENAGFRS